MIKTIYQSSVWSSTICRFYILRSKKNFEIRSSKSLHRISVLHTNLQPQHVQNHKIRPTSYLSTKKSINSDQNCRKTARILILANLHKYLMENIGNTYLFENAFCTFSNHKSEYICKHLRMQSNSLLYNKNYLKKCKLNWKFRKNCTHFARNSFAQLYSTQNLQS